MNISETIFYPATVKEWNMLGSDIQSPKSFNIFKLKVLKFIQPKTNSLFNCLNSKGVKLITNLRLGLSHLRDYKVKQSFQGCLNPFCTCGTEFETTAHYLLYCPNYLHEIKT